MGGCRAERHRGRLCGTSSPRAVCSLEPLAFLLLALPLPTSKRHSRRLHVEDSRQQHPVVRVQVAGASLLKTHVKVIFFTCSFCFAVKKPIQQLKLTPSRAPSSPVDSWLIRTYTQQHLRCRNVYMLRIQYPRALGGCLMTIIFRWTFSSAAWRATA